MIRALSPGCSCASHALVPAVPSFRPGPRLRFDPLAWLKLQFFAATWDCAVGGFGLAGGGDDPLRVERFVTVPQHVTPDGVRFDAAEAAPSRPRRRRRRRPRPHGPAHVLILTHPGTDPTPTVADEALFAATLGHLDWSVLLVVARDGANDARLSLTGGPVRSLPLAVEVDWPAWARFVEDDEPGRLPRLIEAWKDEYARHVRFDDALVNDRPVHAPPLLPPRPASSRHHLLFGDEPLGSAVRVPARHVR